eukprot:scaffold30518_cov67-Phaeocystis_antarctica.AAC.2
MKRSACLGQSSHILCCGLWCNSRSEVVGVPRVPLRLVPHQAVLVAAACAARRCGWWLAQPQPAATRSSRWRRPRLATRHRSAPALAAWAACRAARAAETSAAAATRCWAAAGV